MPVVVGIDEAGYGPTLGPLVVAATAWRVPTSAVKSDFWELLEAAVCRKPRRGDWRLHINDSKIVYDRGKGISSLERPVLAFATAAGLDAATLPALVQVACGEPLQEADAPWYRDWDHSLPLSRDTSFEHVTKPLIRAMSANGAPRCIAMMAEIMTARRYNRRVSSTRNKAALVAEQVLRLIQRASTIDRKTMIVRVDRLGGRTHYVDLLRLAFPDRRLHELEISDARSRYHLAGSGGDWYIEFAAQSDREHLPVALASMFAKYLREALMERFNAYWRGLMPGLRPTAGYYTDAHRFLRDIEPAIAPTGLARDQFVRSR